MGLKTALAISSLIGGLSLGSLESKAANAEVTMNTNKTLTWGPWTNDFLINATSGPNGYVSGNTNDWIEESSNVNVTAVADTNYFFTEWTGAPSGLESINPLSFQVYSPWNIGANFDSSSSTSTTSTSRTTTSTTSTTSSTTTSTTSTTIPKYDLIVNSPYGNPTGAGTYNSGTIVTSTVEDTVLFLPGHRKRVTGFSVTNSP
jgi:hypothetical protein